MRSNFIPSSHILQSYSVKFQKTIQSDFRISFSEILTFHSVGFLHFVRSCVLVCASQEKWTRIWVILQKFFRSGNGICGDVWKDAKKCGTLCSVRFVCGQGLTCCFFRYFLVKQYCRRRAGYTQMGQMRDMCTRHGIYIRKRCTDRRKPMQG